MLDNNMIFDKAYEIKNGYLIYCHNNIKIEQINNRVEKKMNANKAHKILSHASPDTCRITSKELGWLLTGEFKKCIHCSLAKIKTEKIKKKVKFRKKNLI